jgi:mono/diheme cytochrome c family protein
VSEYFIKTVLACFLLAAGLGAFLSMAALMGRAEHRIPPERLRKLHRTAGLIFAALLIPLAYFGLHLLAKRADALPLRGVLHFVLAVVLLGLVVLKILFARAYRQLLRFAPGIGLALFVLTLVLFFMTAGFFLLRRLGAPKTLVVTTPAAMPAGTPDAAIGARLFAEHCASCHRLSDGAETAVGPDLRGLLKKDTLPASGRPATPANARAQVLRPVGTMPAFTGFSETELASLLAYLETL